MENNMKKPIVYIDMDNVLVDFPSAFPLVEPELLQKYANDKDEISGIFSLMQPMAGAVEAVYTLAPHFELYALSTAPWGNPSAWTDKLLWIKQYFGEGEDNPFYKHLILSHNKHLNIGDFLIDDRTKNGAGEFTGEHIHFQTDPRFPDWQSVCDYLLDKVAPKADFAAVGIEPETQLKRPFNQLVYLNPYWAKYERWVYEGIIGHSLIFLERDVAMLSDEDLVKVVTDAGYNTANTTVTRQRNGYAFVNFDFESD